MSWRYCGYIFVSRRNEVNIWNVQSRCNRWYLRDKACLLVFAYVTHRFVNVSVSLGSNQRVGTSICSYCNLGVKILIVFALMEFVGIISDLLNIKIHTRVVLYMYDWLSFVEQKSSFSHCMEKMNVNEAVIFCLTTLLFITFCCSTGVTIQV